jgi:hypothetical protein
VLQPYTLVIFQRVAVKSFLQMGGGFVLTRLLFQVSQQPIQSSSQKVFQLDGSIRYGKAPALWLSSRQKNLAVGKL